MKTLKLLLYNILLISTLFISCKKEEVIVNPKKEKSSRVATLPYYNEATFTPIWSQEENREDKHIIPPFKLINQLGDTISDKTFEDKIYITDFFFTFCPGICPKMTKNMKIVQEAFKDDNDILLLSHSVTPTHDTPEKLNVYALANGVIPSKWHLVTGNKNEIYDLGRNQYFVEEDLGLSKTEDEFLHTENFILVDKQKRIRGIYNGLNKTSVNQLIADVHTLKNENALH